MRLFIVTQRISIYDDDGYYYYDYILSINVVTARTLMKLVSAVEKQCLLLITALYVIIYIYI